MLRDFPREQPVAILVAQHLAPDHNSLLVGLLASEVAWEVRPAEDGIVPQAGEVYVCPPANDMEVQGGRIRIRHRGGSPGPHPSVDALFSSLAAEAGPRAIGVVLSGTGSDGADGLRQIHAAGGFTIVQDPATAKHPSMPESAINRGPIDRTAPAADIGEVVAQHVAGEIPGRAGPLVAESTLQRIVSAAHSHTGINFSTYKRPTLHRQISRRMAALRCTDDAEYLMRLLEDEDEAKALSRELLVTVTSFYRNPDVWEALRVELDGRLSSEQSEVRAWVAGCATGEEAYTLAMMIGSSLGFPEALADRVKIFATDLDEESLALARKGRYPADAVRHLPADLRDRYIVAEGSGATFTDQIKESVVFARHDLARDVPFGRMDIVSCRNVLIYFESAQQELMLSSLRQALNDDGLLVLGNSEGLGRANALFRPLRREKRIFEAAGTAAGISRDIGAAPVPSAAGKPAGARKDPGDTPSLRDALLSALTLPSVVVDADQRLVQVLGDVSRFCRHPEGNPSTSLNAVLRPYLRSEILRLLAIVRATGAEVVGELLDPEDGGRPVRPRAVGLQGSFAGVCVVSFDERTTVPYEDGSEPEGANPLRRELDLTRKALQSTIQDLEVTNEQLQSANQEMQAVTEELQASNEEMETLNEELQASNEELGTLNEELQVKGEELAAANSDLRNVQDAIAQALVVVDLSHRVVSFSPMAVRLFALVSLDIGTPLHAIATTVDTQGLEEAIHRVVTTGGAEVLQVGSTHSEFQIQISAWRDREERVGGAVLVVTDVTGSPTTQSVAANMAADLRLITRGLGASVWTRRIADGSLRGVGADAAELLGVPEDELLADSDSWTRNVVQQDLAVAMSANSPNRPDRLQYRVKRGDTERVLLDLVHGSSAADADTVLGTLRDITEVVSRQRDAADDARIVESMFAPGEQLAVQVDGHGRIVRAGAGAETYLGLPPEVLAGRNLSEMCIANDREPLTTWLRSLGSSGSSDPITVGVMRRDGVLREIRMRGQPVATGDAIVTLSDVTDEVRSLRRLRRDTNYDALTGLLSRSAFESALASAIGRAERNSGTLALIWLDLDGFKDVNDRLGHHVGDSVLKQVGARLAKRKRAGDQAGRVGGDEFCLLIEDSTNLDEVDLAANRYLETLREPLDADEGGSISCSMGIAMYPVDAADPSALMRAADSAMYSAKRQGGDRYNYFQAVMHEAAENRARRRAELAQALRDSSFVLHYQPIVHVGDGSMWGIEALVRRVDAEGVVHSAAEFIELAESSGQIRQIGRLVLQMLAADLENRLPPELVVALNISPAELAHPGFVNAVRESGIVKHTGRVVVEVTERSQMQGNGTAMAAIDLLRSMGARVAVDDYGVGYSNLEGLARLNPSIIKVDQQLVALAGEGDGRGLAFVQSAVNIAQSLGALVVAEGVEHERHLEILREVGVPLAQGYLLGRPMPADDLLRSQGS